MSRDKLKWLFFDMGSTLIDESVAIEHRIREVIEGTNITYEQFLEKKVFFAKQNKPADLATLEYFGLTKTPWHKEDEQLGTDYVFPEVGIRLWREEPFHPKLLSDKEYMEKMRMVIDEMYRYLYFEIIGVR